MSPERLTELHDVLMRSATLLRLGMDARANELVVRAVDGLAEIVPLFDEDLAQALGHLLNELVAAQERGDTLRVADLFEFELAPAFA